MSILKSAIAAAALFAIGATTVIAQTTAPAPTKPAPSAPATAKAPDTAKPAKVKKVQAPQSEISKKCSLEANEKGLKGKPRKAFRKQCMKKTA
jgi:psiF repeat